MIFLTAMAMAAAQPPQLAKYVDCKPMLTLTARDRDVPEVPRDTVQRRGDQRPRPQRRCITLASA
jgi:hypothetical protein